MPEPNAQVADPEQGATATPEPEELSAEAVKYLSDKLGEDFSHEDLESYLADTSNWNAQRNKHNKEAADAAKAAKDAKDEALRVLTGAKAQREPEGDESPKEQRAQTMPQDKFFEVLGIKDPEEPLTGLQAYAIYKGSSDYMLARDDVFGEKFDEQEQKLTRAVESFENTEDMFVQMLADAKVAELLEDFEDADPDEIKRAMRELEASEDFDDELRDVARRSHEKFNAKLTEKEKARKDRKSKSGPRLGPGGKAVSGTKPPKDVMSSEFLQDHMRRHPLGGRSEEPV